MENENSTSGTGSVMIDVIKPETIVSISMSSGYYRKIQSALVFLISGKSTEDLNSAHQQISSQDITDEWVSHYETLLILAKEFEDVARKEGFIVQVTQEKAAEMLKESL